MVWVCGIVGMTVISFNYLVFSGRIEVGVGGFIEVGN